MEIKSIRTIPTMFDAFGGSGFGALVVAALNVPSMMNKQKTKYAPHDLIEKFLNMKERNKIFKDRYELASIYKNLRKISRANADGATYDGCGM